MESTETSRSKPSSRERLLEAARQLFYEQGYNATTLAQISEKSGVNNGLITTDAATARARSRKRVVIQTFLLISTPFE